MNVAKCMKEKLALRHCSQQLLHTSGGAREGKPWILTRNHLQRNLFDNVTQQLPYSMIFNIFNQKKIKLFYSSVYQATFSISTNCNKNALQTHNNVDPKLTRKCIAGTQLLPPWHKCFCKTCR